ncbi:nose resistant to fluoxetine protein 6-like isoform X2 [Adelges cooleyi]|uniref:nose resistant to fluoxetine protein 6-like isoform X2 n=1 Tax=Adelges cooleyi TaxID=133065 RepID=UPI00217FB65A|nr:nose resistant to fluoxetine protein 6-like isoform X2 [Adelges cooleyi]
MSRYIYYCHSHCSANTERKMKTKIVSILLILFFLYKRRVSGEHVDSDIFMTTLPAYAVAAESQILESSSSCRNQLQTFHDAIDNKERWSLKMLDASGQPKSGFFIRNRFWLGVKSQCLTLHNENVHSPPFQVNYYAAHIRYHLEKPIIHNTLILGLCLPGVCTTNNLKQILKNIFEKQSPIAVGNLYGLNYTLVNVNDLKDNYDYLKNGIAITTIIIIIMSFLVMIIGTAYDIIVHQRRNDEINKKSVINYSKNNSVVESSTEIGQHNLTIKQSTFCQILLCFSIHKNTKLLFDTQEGTASIQSAHGLKVIFMAWIIWCHALSFVYDYTDNYMFHLTVDPNLLTSIIYYGSLSVDTFFFLSGFLVVYVVYNQENTKIDQGKEPTRLSFGLVFKLILKKFIRIAPAYFMSVGVAYICFSMIEKRSQFTMSEKVKVNCEKYWWTNVLFINNFFSFDDMCGSWTWYLPNDMQFFIIGKMLAIGSLTYFYTCAAFWSALMIITIAASGYYSFSNDYRFSMFMEKRDFLYKSPVARIGPYLVGIAVAYILFRMKKNCDLNMITNYILWFLAIASLVGSTCLYGNISSVFGVAIYVALAKTIWGLAIGWIIVGCATGNGGLVNKFLSMKMFVPLSRLTYCAYLINPIVIFLLHFDADVPVHIDMVLLNPAQVGHIDWLKQCRFVFFKKFDL